MDFVNSAANAAKELESFTAEIGRQQKELELIRKIDHNVTQELKNLYDQI